ncbi:hypothetical protein HFN69_22085 [Rhizobium laguerreae]|uniref:hypothetical protein n=1 Tax=Rhizobium laguerreae TaxID=1076926 RepID=UPI001C9094BF|nr:hypothetical protein [Rhizobium laguerreae]MBY3544810.1 hypothetical protein [Rhizobium laguerreae]MBY3549267.1 hypothetical protein [Rhizobium laguerreae]
MSIRGVIDKYSVLLLGIALLVILFDYAQIISNYGIYSAEITSTPLQFFWLRAPYNLLYATISLVVCIVLLNYLIRGEATKAGVPTMFYAVVRLRFDCQQPITFDYLLIICLLNIVGALISLYLTQSICHRQVLKVEAKAAYNGNQVVPAS